MLPVLHIQIHNANQYNSLKAGSKQELPQISATVELRRHWESNQRSQHI